MGAFDDLIPKASGGGAFDDLIPKAKDAKGGSATAGDFAAAGSSALGQGVLGIQGGLGGFLQAPGDSTLAALHGGAAVLQKGAADAVNWAVPGTMEIDQGLQDQARQASRDAQAQRETNIAMDSGSWLNPRTMAARLGVGLQEDARTRTAAIQADDRATNPELVRQQQAISDAEGFVPTAKALWNNPLGFSHTMVRSIPDMALGLGAARAVSGATMAGGARAAALAEGEAAKAIIAKAAEQAVERATVAGMASEGLSSAYGGREGVFQQVMNLPPEKIVNSPRWAAVLAETGGNADKARQVLANELADQVPLLSMIGTMAGTRIVNRMFGEDTTAALVAGARRTTMKDVARNPLHEGVEEVLQSIPEDLVQHRAGVQADPSQKYDFGGSVAQNLAAGVAMGGAGTGGRFAYQTAQDVRSGRPADAATPATETPGVAPVDLGGAVNADEVLGAAPEATPAAPAEPSAAETALKTPRALTALDRVQEIDAKLQAEPQAPDAPALAEERAQLAKDWPATVPGAPTSFSTEAGARVDAQYALIEAGDLQASHDTRLKPNPAYPTELQPRDRTRAASEAQIASIAGKMDPARLGLSADAATGAPIIGADGLVESGNARTIALQRIYSVPGQKAEDYKAWLAGNAAQFGIDPQAVATMEKPVLVRVRTTPVNRAEFARQANASTVAAMSPSEQGKADAARIDAMDDLNPDEQGDFSTSRDFIRRFMARLPGTEQAGMIDANGALSSAGYARVRNAVLAKAYGDSSVLTRMTESMDDNLRNVSKALMIAAPRVAQARDAIGQGRRYDSDLAPHLISAVEELGALKDAGTSVHDALAQAGLMGEQFTPETRDMLEFLSENMRRPRRMADFITAYYDALDSAGDPAQGSLLGETVAPSATDLMGAARRTTEGVTNAKTRNATDAKRTDAGKGPAHEPRAAGQPGDATRDRGRDQGNGAANDAPQWVAFGKETGTLGVPRSEMPQVRVSRRAELLAFLNERGIGHARVNIPADTLKPTQAEYSREKVDSAVGLVDENNDTSAVLVSSDGYVMDGHHRWLARAEAHTPVHAIQFDAPIGRLLDAVMQFPGAHVSRDSAGSITPDARSLAVADMRAAAADLGDFLTRHMRAAVVPENDPKVMDAMVRLFDAAIRIVGSDLKRATAWVKDYLRKHKGEVSGWQKIQAATYRKAAERALAGLEVRGQQMGLFSDAEQAQADLFGAPDANAVIDLASGNFKVPAVESFLPAAVVARAKAFVKELSAALPPVEISAAERASAETILKPMLEAATAVKPDFDQKVIDIARQVGALGQMVAGVKTMGRSASKFVIDGLVPEQMRDILRATIVVSAYSDAQGVVDAIYRNFEVVPGRVKNRTDQTIKAKDLDPEVGFLKSGYGDVLVNVRIGGVQAEIQINVPEMLAAKAGEGHALYDIERAQPEGSHERAMVQRAQEEYYAGAAAAASARALAMKAASGIGIGSESGGQYLATSSSPLTTLNLPPSGKTTASDPDSRSKNLQPSGNLSGNFIATSPTQNIAQREGKPYTQVEGETSDVRTSSNDPKGAAGPRAGRKPAPGAAQAGGGTGGLDLFSGPVDGAGSAPGAEVGQPGPVGVRGQNQNGRSPEPRGAAGAGAGVPASRDIAPKTGQNYRFTDEDLSYAGSWPKKAEQNVAAVELLRQLQTDGRQATREEQRVLAKFIGWGAGELSNNLFGKKLDAASSAFAAFNAAKAAIADGAKAFDRYHANYWSISNALAKAGNHVRYGESIPASSITLKNFGLENDVARWLGLRDRLKAALTPEEWAEASRSTQYAHFTSKAIVRSMWNTMERFGFKGGVLLEPGAGNGVFPGLMPEAMAVNSAYTGIEFDSITGGILKQLQPDERILVESFVDSRLPKNFYDAAVGNPPFSRTAILTDPEYKKHAFSLHDYFFAKTIDRVKPGGIVTFVTSRYTMDKQGDKARKYLAERADLVGAIRLPQTAFQKNAGTEVVTDVLFLRKKVPGEAFEHGRAWTGLATVQTKDGPAQISEYFAAHPEMVLGTHALQGSMYSKNEYTVLPIEGDIEALFDAAAAKLPANIYRAARGSAAEAAQVREIDFNPKAKKEGNYYVSDKGALMQREGGVGQAVLNKSAKDAEVIKAFVPLRDALKQAHYDQLTDGDWPSSLSALQAAYKTFTDAHGLVNQYVEKTVRVKVDEIDDEGSPTGRKVADEELRRAYPLLAKFKDDPDYSLVAALEKVNDDTGAITPSGFLTARVLGKPEAPKIAGPHDALLATLNDTGRVDIAAIAARSGLSEDDAIEGLGSAVYRDPEGDWVTADEYLSGNVRAKLDAARAAAKADRNYARNVAALEAAQPAPKSPAMISASIGMNWIPGSDYARFLKDTAGVTADIKWNDATRQWVVREVAGGSTTKATADWGTGARNATELLEHALTGRAIRVTQTVGTGSDRKTVFNAVATEAANQKLGELKAEFERWIWGDAERSTRLVQEYNDKFNTTVPRAFDGAHLTLPGASKLFNIFDHVKRGAWRVIQSGNTYLAHAVGSGKTFQMVISAMEMKRLGMVQKPMVVVPNHMLQQFSREWQELYPAARLMVADENNFHTDNRRRFVSRVALSDLDGVIITHSAFKLMDLDPKFKEKIIDEQLVYMRAALEQAEDEEGGGGRKSTRVKQIEKQIENLEQKLEAAISSEGKDRNVRFDELGVDFLYVDEAHEFRKLDFATARQVKGIDPKGSARALDLYIKSRYLEEKKPGRSLVMASGTPVTNTIAELYTVGRFMDRQAMIERGIEDFDSWAAMFGRERTELEPNAAGRYEPVTRFSKFVNVPELTQMFRNYADVVTSDQLAGMLGDKRPKVEGGSRKIVITPKSNGYAAYQKQLALRVEESRAWKPSKDEPNNPDPIIKFIGDGRLAAIDMRFVNPSSQSDPKSKLNSMIDDVIRMFKETADFEYVDKSGAVEPNKGAAMMVFSDLGFGAGVAATRGFNARAWFEKRLRDAGVPAAQVAFMSDAKKSTDKAKLFKDVNAGRVRILIGSSKNMGTGVNAQQRLKALFHLDSPWYPADLEQREGRIVRQGNKNKLVQLFAYAAKGTYDENMWKMLASKQYFIDQALNGDENLREVEDLDSQGQYDMAAAMVADDPRIIQLAGAKAEAEKLQRLFRAHEEQRMKFRDKYRWSQDAISANEKALPAAEAMATKMVDLNGDAFTAKIGRTAYAERSKWGEAMLAQFKELNTSMAKSQQIGEISGLRVNYVARKGDSSYSAFVQLDTPIPTPMITAGDESPVGIAMRAQNAVADLARVPQRLREIIKGARDTMEALRERLETPFPMAGMLSEKIKEAQDLEATLAAESKDRAWRVERIDTGLGHEVMANSAAAAIDKAVESNGGLPGEWRAVEKKTGEEPAADGTVLSRGAGGGIALPALHAVKRRVVAAMPNLPNVHVLASPALAPERLRAFIEARGALADAQGALFDGEIYLFASGISDEVQAEHVLAEHEAAHAGLRGLLGDGLKQSMQAIYNNNADVRRRAAPLVESGLSVAESVEEVLVDTPSAQLAKLKGWRAFVGRMRDALKAGGFTGLAARMDAWLAGYQTEQERADLFAADLVRQARAFVVRKPQMGGDTRLSRQTVTETPAFKKWFGDSKVVDADGKPLVVYHGAPDARFVAEDGVFKTINEKYGGSDPGKRAFWFAKDMDTAVTYADDRRAFDYQNAEPGVIGVYLAMKNPLIVDGGGTHWREAQRRGKTSDVIAEARAGGNDGVIVRNVSDRYNDNPSDASSKRGRTAPRTTDTYVVFDSAQIKSATGNNGQFDPKNPDIRMSVAATPGRPAATGPALDAEQRADALIHQSAATPKPIDAIARTLTRITGLERLTTMAYGQGGRLLDWLVPETVKAGIVSDYGVPQAVIDHRASMQGTQREELRKAGKLIDKLSSLTRAESRVAYEWMNDDGTDPRAYVSLMHGLPEESVRVLQETQQMIDTLSKEAVRLGQLDPEVYARHKFAYLRRSYFKHALEVEGTNKGKASRQRAISILGDQYKGRGMVAKAPMSQIKNGAPDWWKRKVVDGKADTSLKGEKFERLERRAAAGAGTRALEGMGENTRAPKLLEVHYWPEGQPKPAKYADWESAGSWEVRGTQGGDLIVWRDFTKEERTKMGEIDEARYAVGMTLHRMIHDVEVGRYLEWLAQNNARKPGETIDGTVVAASDRYLDTFKMGEWVQVPDTSIQGTAGVKKYGKLAGHYLPGPIWNDLRQTMGGPMKPWGEVYSQIMKAWKISKTSLSPSVHMNNVMSNMVMADWHDVNAGHVAKALRIVLAARMVDHKGVLGAIGNSTRGLGIADREAAKEVMTRYENSGGSIGSWATQEIANEQMAPIIEALQRELATTSSAAAQAEIGIYSAMQHVLHARFPQALEAFKSSRPASAVATDAKNLIGLYQSEDDIFRLGAWLKAKEEGMSDMEAGNIARKAFLDYSINAPWVAAMRQTMLPFISFTYRALPMLLETAAKKPHKILKLMAFAGALNALGSMLAGGGDDERKLLPEEKSGRVWGMVPKLIRMPWNDVNGSPVYLDIRRWIPVGDVADLGQGHSAIPLPPSLMPGGPLAMIGEVIANRSNFTGQNITMDSDTATEKATKIADYLWKSFMPNILGVPGTYATTGVVGAVKGRTDAFGRELSVTQAALSAFGVKVGSYPADVLRRNLVAKRDAEVREIGMSIGKLRRQFQTNSITREEYETGVKYQQAKQEKVLREAAEKMN